MKLLAKVPFGSWVCVGCAGVALFAAATNQPVEPPWAYHLPVALICIVLAIREFIDANKGEIGDAS